MSDTGAFAPCRAGEGFDVTLARWMAAALLLVLPALPSPAQPRPGPFTNSVLVCGRKQVVRLNQRICGQVLDFTHNHGVDRRIWSEAIGMPRDMYVYLPPGFDPRQRYPLMIWLHGFSQDEKKFLELAPIFDQMMVGGKLPPFIIAAPDGSISGRPSFTNAGSFYLDSLAGNFEQYLERDVWNFLVTNFPIRPEREAHVLAGASMGGFAAFHHGFERPSRYGVLAGIHPPLNLRYEDCHGRYRAPFDPNCIGWMQELRPNRVIGRFDGIILVRMRRMTDPIVGRGPGAVAAIARVNPTEMLFTYNIQPGQFEMFIGYAGRDQLNLAAQVESFLYFADKKGIHPAVVYVPNGTHSTETGLKMFPAFAAWLSPRLAPYSPGACRLGAP